MSTLVPSECDPANSYSDAPQPPKRHNTGSLSGHQKTLSRSRRSPHEQPPVDRVRTSPLPNDQTRLPERISSNEGSSVSVAAKNKGVDVVDIENEALLAQLLVIPVVSELDVLKSLSNRVNGLRL